MRAIAVYPGQPQRSPGPNEQAIGRIRSWGTRSGHESFGSVQAVGPNVTELTAGEPQLYVHGADESISRDPLEICARRLVWALGWDIESGANTSATGILRHYNSNGELLGAYLPRGQFRAYGKQHPVFLTSEEGSAVLEVTGDRVGMFLPSARLWLETDYQGRELCRVPVTLPALPGGDPPNDLVGAGRIIPGGQLLVWLRSGRYATMDRTTGRFDSPRPRVQGRGDVLGVEGDKALVGARRQSPNEVFVFEWVPIADQVP